MRTGRSDAMLLLSKWLTDRSLLLCEGSFSKFAFSLNARILSINDQELRILSDDTFSELTLSFTPEMEFGYGDSRHTSENERQYESCLVVFFGPLPQEGSPDTIAIAPIAPLEPPMTAVRVPLAR
jgi:hypothetical protein